ncbi:hypothetical protein OIU85_003106 [Salix viminalis]|uniref:C-JID domain-containing protein n=1 Tax=Salix viminalis TaxID=40686 RepID=A0A9Q0T113_SALVM|nr:hypothetical protein OIU85_003106 [Salix viminalis]
MHLKIQSGEPGPRDIIRMILPGSEIPEWFGDKGIRSSLTIQLPSNCHQLKGITFCLVFLPPLPSHVMLYALKFCRIYLEFHDGDDDEDFFSKTVYSHYKFSMKRHLDHVFLKYRLYDESNNFNSCHSDHMFLQYELDFVDLLRKYSGKEVTFKFYIEMSNVASYVIRNEKSDVIREPCELKSCGVYLHFDENIRADDTLSVRDIVCYE